MNAPCDTWFGAANSLALREPDDPDFDPAGAEEAEFVAQILTASRTSEALQPKQRALAALAAVTVLRMPSSDLKAHVRAAADAGASRDEIVSTIVEAALYAGLASAHAGLEAAFAVFRKHDTAGAACRAADDSSPRARREQPNERLGERRRERRR